MDRCPECNDRAAREVRAQLYPGLVQGSLSAQPAVIVGAVTREEYEGLLRRVEALESRTMGLTVMGVKEPK